MRAVFKDTDGRWTYVCGYREFDLGHQDPGRYMWASTPNGNRQQVCNDGKFRGNTLSWPCGKHIGWREVKDRLGRPMTIGEYDVLPTEEILKWLAFALAATPYKTRESFARHYWPRLAKEEAAYQ